MGSFVKTVSHLQANCQCSCGTSCKNESCIGLYPKRATLGIFPPLACIVTKHLTLVYVQQFQYTFYYICVFEKNVLSVIGHKAHFVTINQIHINSLMTFISLEMFLLMTCNKSTSCTKTYYIS